MEQRKNIGIDDNEQYEPIMLQIACYLKENNVLRESTHNIDKKYWNIELTSVKDITNLVQYLNNYPLLTAKQNDVEDWLQVYYLIIDKKHLTNEGKIFIKNIKYNMNRNRKIFNWDHLNKLNNVK